MKYGIKIFLPHNDNIQYIIQILPEIMGFGPHGTHHSLRCYNIVTSLYYKKPDINHEELSIIQTIALLHDIGQIKIDDGYLHGEAGVEIAKGIINEFFNEDDIISILNGIKNHVGWKKRDDENIHYLKYIYCADLLEISGAINLIRQMQYNKLRKYSFEESVQIHDYIYNRTKGEYKDTIINIWKNDFSDIKSIVNRRMDRYYRYYNNKTIFQTLYYLDYIFTLYNFEKIINELKRIEKNKYITLLLREISEELNENIQLMNMNNQYNLSY